MLQRLDKLIASQGTLSRSEAVRLIRTGRVMVGETVCRDPAIKIDPDSCSVTVAGKPLLYQQYVYIMMNKPAGILCVSRDPKAPTVVDLLPSEQKRKGLFPAGRLDKDTTGLVILTDDGDFAHRILAPKKEIVKRYHARLDGPLTEADVDAFQQGIVLADGTRCRPASLQILQGGEQALAEVKITEGRYHQIKRMFGVRGLGVTALRRLSIGGLCLDETLAAGESRFLTDEERLQLFA